jgi:DNA-3-methyladenine glycosylase
LITDWLAEPSLGLAFFSRPATTVARELLGQLVIREVGSDILVARIVETEAYESDIDEASHAFRGRTTRNQTMFGEAGRAYIYQIYGIHYCINVVTTHGGGPASAVLLRGMEPLKGIEAMRARRKQAPVEALLRGPGNIGAGLALDLSLDGHDLMQPPLRLVAGPPAPEPIITTTRIGITRSRSLPWRYYLFGATGVSRRDRNAELAQMDADRS